MCKQDAAYLERKPSLFSSLALFCVISQAPRWLLVFRYLFQWQNLAKHWKVVPGKIGCSLTSASSGRVAAPAAQGSTGLGGPPAAASAAMPPGMATFPLCSPGTCLLQL